jgi:hypothetical protein
VTAPAPPMAADPSSPADATAGTARPTPAADGAPASRRWAGRPRQWRGWLAIALIIAVGAIIIALIHSPPPAQYLSPDSVAPTGTHALADVLTGLGRRVQTKTSVPAAIAAATAGATLVITSPRELSAAELAALARVPADVLLVGPDPAALAKIVPAVTTAGAGPPQRVVVTPAGCTLRAAVLAGRTDAGGVNIQVLNAAAPLSQCYLSTYGPTLVQTRVRDRLVTVLGAGAPLTNGYLARQGNAALAINLLPTRRIVWLLPPQGAAIAALAGPAGGRSRSFWDLLPLAVYLVAAQLGFALLLAVGWRVRRLGPLVTEPLPVVVLAAETVIGHGRLYQARRARGKAAAALRGALLARLAPALGLPAGSGSDGVTAAVAQRSAASPDRIGFLLFGPAPRTDAALVTLVRDLDDLAKEVGLT